MPNTREKLIELLIEADDYGEDVCRKGCKICSHSNHVDCGYHVQADYLIAKGVTIATDNNVGSKWIPVTERLPNEDEYTAKAKDGEEYYVRLLIAHKTDIIEYEIGYYDGYKWMTEMPIRLIKDVVAWMPFPNMPQPPKGE